MRLLRKLFLEDLELKVLSVFLAIVLWLWVNLGNTVPFLISKEVALLNERPDYAYRVEPKRLKIKLGVPQGMNVNNVAEEIKAYVDVKGLGPGEYVLQVKIDTKFGLLLRVDEIEPSYVKVFVKEKPRQGL